MVSPNDDVGGAGEEEGRTEANLHQPWDDHSDHIAREVQRDAGWRPHGISKRLDGEYAPRPGNKRPVWVHGWYYPDPEDVALSTMDATSTPGPKVPTADEERY